MKKILVSLVSQQRIPNFLFIKDKEFQDIDEYLFLTTEYAEKNQFTEHILEATGLEENVVHKIKIVPDDIPEIHKQLKYKLQDFGFSKDDQFSINITGGTKIMALAVYDYFVHKGFNCKVFYLAFPKTSYKQIYPIGDNFPLSHSLNLKEYLACYGLQTTLENNHPSKMFHSPEKLNKLNHKELKRILNAFSEKEKQNTSIEKYYFKNGWFEEYIYNIIKKELNLNDSELGLNVKLTQAPSNVTNEFDVMFLYKFKLHVIECKTGLTIKGGQKNGLLTSSLYKLKALKDDFGLFIKGYLMTKADLRDFKKKEPKPIWKGHQLRADSLNVTLADKEDVKTPEKLKAFIKKHIS